VFRNSVVMVFQHGCRYFSRRVVPLRSNGVFGSIAKSPCHPALDSLRPAAFYESTDRLLDTLAVINPLNAYDGRGRVPNDAVRVGSQTPKRTICVPSTDDHEIRVVGQGYFAYHSGNVTST